MDKDGKPDAKLANWAAEQLRVDALCTKEKMLKGTLVATFGEMPARNQIKKCLQVVNNGNMKLVYWQKGVRSKPVLLCAYTELQLGMDPQQANRVVSRFHYKCFANEPATCAD